MNIFAKPGTKIRFIPRDNGHDPDREHAKEYLTEGQIYTVKMIDVGHYYSEVEIKEIPNQWFNTVLFDDVDVTDATMETEIIKKDGDPPHPFKKY